MLARHAKSIFLFPFLITLIQQPYLVPSFSSFLEEEEVRREKAEDEEKKKNMKAKKPDPK